MRQLSSPLAFMILLSTLGTRPNSSMGYRVASSNLNAYPALTDVLRACRHTELVKNYQRLAIWRIREEESWRARHGSNHQKLNIEAELLPFHGV